ncbi:MAG: hypothetical protein V8S96_09190 [Lachnospiraceae bacterium]
MSGLLLCRDGKAKKPYPVPELGISLYSAEELCYYIYHYVFLLEPDFVDEELLEFIGTGLGLSGLEAKIRRWIAEEADLSQVLYMILQDVHYYNETELAAFRAQLEWLKKAKPFGAGQKESGLYLLGTRKYEAAIRAYDQIEAGEPDGGMTREFMGALYHNKGMACIGLFDGPRALSCLEQAYENLEQESLLKEIFLLCQMEPELELPSAIKTAVLAEQQMKWEKNIKLSCTHLRYSGNAKEDGALWETNDPEKSRIQRTL